MRMRNSTAKKTIKPRKRKNKSVKRIHVSRTSSAPKTLRILGVKAGLAASKKLRRQSSKSIQNVHAEFTSWYFQSVTKPLPYGQVRQIAEAYQHAFYLKKKSTNLPILLPLAHSAAAVVSASDEEKTLGAVLNELSRLPLQEIIVVLNGCSDNSYALAREYPLVTIIYEPERVGHDVGRAIGAQMTTADTVLFTDGDMVIKAEQLAPFLYAVDTGVDMALNDLRSYLPSFANQDAVTRLKSYLNSVLNRRDLGATSLISVPHALSKKCIQTIGYSSLVVPPLAQTTAIQKGCTVEVAGSVDVITKNRRRIGNVGKGNSVEQMIIGDHAEALSSVLSTLHAEAEAKTEASLLSRVEVARWRNAK